MKKLLLVLAFALLAAGCSGNGNTSQNPGPSPTPARVSPTTPATSTPTVASRVKIIKLTPSSGKAGTKVTISGSGFTPALNQVMFGDSNGRHHPDGSADNVIETVPSADGKTLSFTVPAAGPSGIICDSQNHCVGISAMLRQPGNYKVIVSNANGKSNALIFTITK